MCVCVAQVVGRAVLGLGLRFVGLIDEVRHDPKYTSLAIHSHRCECVGSCSHLSKP